MEQAMLDLTHKMDTLTAQVAYLTEQAQAVERGRRIDGNRDADCQRRHAHGIRRA